MGWSEEKNFLKSSHWWRNLADCKTSWQKQNSACRAESGEGRGFSQTLEKHTKIYEWQLFRGKKNAEG